LKEVDGTKVDKVATIVVVIGATIISAVVISRVMVVVQFATILILVVDQHHMA